MKFSRQYPNLVSLYFCTKVLFPDMAEFPSVFPAFLSFLVISGLRVAVLAVSSETMSFMFILSNVPDTKLGPCFEMAWNGC